MRGTGPAPRPSGWGQRRSRGGSERAVGGSRPAPPRRTLRRRATPCPALPRRQRGLRACVRTHGGRACPGSGVRSRGGGTCVIYAATGGHGHGYVHPRPCGSVHTQAARRCVCAGGEAIGVGARCRGTHKGGVTRGMLCARSWVQQLGEPTATRSAGRGTWCVEVSWWRSSQGGIAYSCGGARGVGAPVAARRSGSRHSHGGAHVVRAPTLV